METLGFRHLLEDHQLAEQILATVNATLADKGMMLRKGTVVDVTLIAEPISTKHRGGERDAQMHPPKKVKHWHFDMKCHVGVDADSGLVQTMMGTLANVNDVTQPGKLVHGAATDVFAGAAYQGAAKREEKQGVNAKWHVAIRPGKRRGLDKSTPVGLTPGKLEHTVRVIKREFGYVLVKYTGLTKNTDNLTTQSALSNLWMARRSLLQELQE